MTGFKRNARPPARVLLRKTPALGREGIVLVLAAVIFVGYRMWATSCPAPTIIEVGVLTVIPIVYLVLMYLTFVSQR